MKMTQEAKASAKLAAEERAALEFQNGWDAGLAGEPSDSNSLVFGAGFVYGSREKVRRDKKEETEESDS
jgi:hypothetical protein